MSDNKSRVELRCQLYGEPLTVWVDTGSPNTLVSSNFLTRFGLQPVGARRYSGKVAGIVFRGKPSIRLPSIEFHNCLPLRNVRALAALDEPEWDNIIVLGLNVLNHLTIKIDRPNGIFEWLEHIASDVPGSSNSKFDHMIWQGKYLLGKDA
jgi:hypothetical protein